MSQQINLFNPIFLKQKKYFSSVAMLQAIGLVIVGIAGVYGFSLYQVSSLAEQANATATQHKQAQEQLIKVGAQFSPKKTESMQEEIRVLQAKLKVRQSLINDLQGGVLGNTNGYSEYMRAFARQAINGLWLVGFNIVGSGNEMTIKGRVLAPELLPSYILKLNQEPSMRGRSFAALNMTATEVKKEEMKARLTPAAYIEFILASKAAAVENK
jgi:hypothetical protein